MARGRACWCLSVAVFAASACAPEIPQEAPPETVRALWNPTTGELPTPTNLVLSESGTLDLPLDASLSAAELEFRAYLNTLDGYPLNSSLAIPLSGPISEAGLGGSFVVLDVNTGESVDVTPRFDGVDTITATAVIDDETPGWQSGHTYAFGLRGYEGGVRGADGELVVADAPFFLVRSTEDLRDHPTAMPGETRDERRETAETLEEVRQGLLPLYDAIAQRGVPRDEIAVASVFSTTSRPAFWFDADRRIVPVPNGLLTDSETGLVNIPVEAGDDETITQIKETISTYDGASTSGPISFYATAPIDTDTVNPDNVKLFEIDLESGSATEVIDVEHGRLDDPTHAFIRPGLALEPSTYYVMTATREVTSSGTPLDAQPISALLRNSAQLSQNGESRVSTLDDDTAALLEEWRVVAQPALRWLEDRGTPREDVSLVAPFKTLSTVRALMDLRAELYTEQTPTVLTNVLTRTPLERGLPLILNSVETITTGTFEVRDYLDPRTRRFRSDGPQPTRVDFTLTVPEGVSTGTPIPVVLFGHGLFTSRELSYFIADRLAEAGFAVFSFDLPYHGKRSVCITNSDCEGTGTCDELGQCSNGEFSQFEGPFPDGPTYPVSTGTAFIEVDNIVGARDHFMQAALDMYQALRVIRAADWPAATGGYALDGNDVVYLGMSLGGILGSIIAGTEPTIDDFVLNVAGGDLFTIFRDSDAFESAFDEVLEDRMTPEGSDEYFELEAALRWLLDRTDPINTAPFALREFEYVDPVDGTTKVSPVKRVMLQVAEGDVVVPNSSSRILSEAMGLQPRIYTPAVSNHVFLFDPTSLEAFRARNDMVDFFEAR